MKKFLIYLHEQCAIDNPHDVRTWDKDMSATFVDKEFLDEKILCSKETRRKKKRMSHGFPSEEMKHFGCFPFRYQTQANTCDEENFYAITLEKPPDELRLVNQFYGGLLRVDALMLSTDNNCKVVTVYEKDHIKIPSGIVINTVHHGEKCDDRNNGIEIFEHAPCNTAPVMKKIIDLIKKQRYMIRMQNIYLDLENLKLDAKIPNYINLGCITPTSTIFSIMHASDLVDTSQFKEDIKYKINCIYVAYGYSKIIKFYKWNPRLLDDILLVAKDNMLQELNLEFVIHRHYIKLEHLRPVIVGRLNSQIKNSFNIYHGLLHFFLKSTNCVFHSEQHYLLISRFNQKFYVYDPSGRLENLRTDEKYGLSCAVRLDNLCNVTYLILKSSNLFDNSPFTLSEIKCTEFFEVSLRNCELIKTRLKTAIEHEEPVIEHEIIYDLDGPDEFIIEEKRSEHFEITDSDLSNYNLTEWNHDHFNNAEIVKKFVDQLLLGIHGEPPKVTIEEYIDKLLDRIIERLINNISKPHQDANVIDTTEKAIKEHIDNYIEVPNNTAILVTTKEINSDLDFFSVNLAFVTVFLEYGKICEWDYQYLDYIYHMSYAIKSYFEPKIADVIELNKFYCSIQVDCDQIDMAFTQLVKTYQDRLKGYLLNYLKKYHLLLVISDTVIFVIIKCHDYYYYFDGKLRDTLEVWHYVQHQFGCIVRFKTLGEIISLLKRYQNKKFDYYHIFKVDNEQLTQNDFYEDFISVNLYKYHRRRQDGLFKIQGNTCLPDRNIITVGLMRSCYFTAVYVILFIMRLPLARWNADIIDLAIKNGPLLAKQIEKTEGTNIMYQKRFIENLAIDGYYFNVFVKEVFSATYNQDLFSQLKYFFTKRSLLILQFINTSFVILKDFGYHLFDPYASLELSEVDENYPLTYDYPEYCYSANNVEVFEDNNKASWIFFMDLHDLIQYIKPRSILDENTKKGYLFWVVNMVSYRRNSSEINRGIELKPDNNNYRRINFEYEESLKSNIPNEQLRWVLDGNDYLPIWSRLLIKSKRSKIITNSITYGTELVFQWHNFAVEKENDIFSIWGTISPRSYVFKRNRNKQYYGIYIMALFIMHIYNLAEMTSNLIDFIVIEGDRYFNYSVEHISTLDYEISLDDMIKKYRVGNFQFIWRENDLNCNNGILYTCKRCLSKELDLFFKSHRYKSGIIECKNKILAFGVDVHDGYFVYDAQSYGFPLFLDCHGCAYMLRCLSLKRLTYLIVRTLGIYEGGHPFIVHALHFDIKLRDAKFYKGLYKRKRIFAEKPIRPECIEHEPEPEPEEEEVADPQDPFLATRIT